MIPYEFSAERFSRWMAYVLRHNPDRYGLRPDRHGYVNFQEFLRIASRRYPEVSPEQLRNLIEGEGAARFEVDGDRLRARYGHSIQVEPAGPAVEPPVHLYHGADASSVDGLLCQGLEPVDRRMLHLSVTVDEALAVTQRRTAQAATIRIDALAASHAGIAFYREGNLYLAAAIPPSFLHREPLPARPPPVGA